MERAVRLVTRSIEYAIAACLVVMTGLVFANVVARYAFDSGIPVSEELSRYCLVWLVFLGAVVAMRDRAHLGVDSFVRRLPGWGKKLCFVTSALLMLGCCWILFQGSLHHMALSHGNVSPVTGIPQSYVFLAGVVAAAGIALIILGDLWLLVTGRLETEALVQVAGEEG